MTDVVRTGPLERSETWRGVVRLRGTVSVPPHRTLAIDPGCHVVAEGGDGRRLVVEGTLIAHGSLESPIDIGPESSAPWEGVQVRGAGASTSLHHARVRSARIGVYALAGHLIVEECFFADCAWGIYVHRPSGGLVRGCFFRGVETPVGLASPCPGVVFDGNLAAR